MIRIDPPPNLHRSIDPRLSDLIGVIDPIDLIDLPSPVYGSRKDKVDEWGWG